MFKNKNKGFSLVELIVVIAIMAVLIVVLAPALLQYTEHSRAQKDDSAMSEVTNAVQLALSDQDCYDEVIHYNAKDNVSCYIDTNKEGDYEKTITKEATQNSPAQYTFSDDSRLLDETPYFAAGSMRGVTITFSPNTVDDLSYHLANGIVNQFHGESNSLSSLSNFYNRLRQSVGDSITLSSQTYRNSEYTIFIVIGSTGGNQSSAQDAITVYGQFSGTNLSFDEARQYTRADKIGMSSTNVYQIGDIQFEEGMTWAEWINSEYNTVGAKIYNNRLLISGVGYLHCYDKDGNFISSGDINDPITNDVIYEITWMPWL